MFLFFIQKKMLSLQIIVQTGIFDGKNKFYFRQFGKL